MAKRGSATIAISFLILLTISFLAEGYGERRVGGKTEVKNVKSNEEVQKLGRFCVAEFNRQRRKSDEVHGGGKLKFLEVVEAQKQVVSGLKYYLKISTIQDGESKMFDSIVVVKPWLRSKQLLDFAPSRMFIFNRFF